MSAWRSGWRLARWSAASLTALGAGAVATMLLRSPAPDATRVSARIGPPLSPRYAGVNLASASFGSKVLPGIHGRDYIYPTARDAAPFRAAGMNAIRLPFRWERIQQTLGQPLDAAELRRLDGAIAALRGFELIILDVHNYGGYDHAKLGTAERPATTLIDLWTRLATRYRSDPRVAFGIMNEPIEIDAAAWAGMAAATLRAIRATGARNLVLVPGVRWTGAHSWTKGTPSNAQALAGLRDPAGNMAFEMHQYVDGNSSGTGSDCVTPAIAASRMRAATAWLREQRARGFLGEFGAPPNPGCLAALESLLATIDADNDVWLGWTYWAAGARWNKYAMSVQPGPNGPKPQMAVLLRHLPR